MVGAWGFEPQDSYMSRTVSAVGVAEVFERVGPATNDQGRQRQRGHFQGARRLGASPRRAARFQPAGKATYNAFIESFNSRLWQECLNQNWFTSLAEAREIVEAWPSITEYT